MAKVIRSEGLSKAYQLGNFGTGTLSRDLERYWAKLRGQADPFLKVGETNDRTLKGQSDIVWSLKDVNFEVEQGDAVGIIGRNGAGKSTLLKILSRVTAPTSGSVKIKGRIASLLEVGTGFHPELSGRENIFLNGAILGMRKTEIRRKFDEIVSFAGVERYIDTPVKRYSSGMYVRLAFAVAAHLESEILIVDEVLAVGDAEFQKKCLGKMGDISKGEGRTILFVTHNMGALKNLCNKTLLLHNGSLSFNGPVNEGIQVYLGSSPMNENVGFSGHNPLSGGFMQILLGKLNTNSEFGVNDNIDLAVVFRVLRDPNLVKLSFTIIDQMERTIFITENPVQSFLKGQNEGKVKVTIPARTLVPGRYKITAALHIPNVQYVELLPEVISFHVIETGSAFYQYANADIGCVFVDCKWTDE